MQSEALVEAVLHRFMIPLDEIGSLEVGTSVPIPLECVSRVLLEGSDGRCVATGKLGQCGGRRAVRVAAGSQSEQLAASELSVLGFAANSEADAVNLENEAATVDPGAIAALDMASSEIGNSDQPEDADAPEMGIVT